MEEVLNKILGELQALNGRLYTVDSRLDEHYRILRALEHASEVHKADNDNLTHQVANLAGELKSFRGETNRRFDILENKIDSHDIQIQILDQKKANKRKS